MITTRLPVCQQLFPDLPYSRPVDCIIVDFGKTKYGITAFILAKCAFYNEKLRLTSVRQRQRYLVCPLSRISLIRAAMAFATSG